jgi:hypothetical protein
MEQALILRKWAKLGGKYSQGDQEMNASMNWNAVQALVSAALAMFDEEMGKLASLLDKSGTYLSLEDPLRTDLGAHRWLKAEREEAYTDWLKWVFEQLGSPTLICKVLGIKTSSLPRGHVYIRREFGIEDEEGQRRRTDLDICLGDASFIRVEVKKSDAEQIEALQLVGQERGFTHYVLILRQGRPKNYTGQFCFRYWDDLCIELRRTIAVLGKQKRSLIQRALLLAFVGAVEENILKLPGGLPNKRITNLQLIAKVKKHLERTVA